MPEEQAEYETSPTWKESYLVKNEAGTVQKATDSLHEARNFQRWHGGRIFCRPELHSSNGGPTPPDSHTPQTDMPETTHEAEYRADQRERGLHFHDLAKRTCQWSKEMGITDEGTAAGQADKMLEEAIETWAAIRGLSNADVEEIQEHADLIAERNESAWVSDGSPLDDPQRAYEARDGIGDVMVTLINTCAAYLREVAPGSTTMADDFLLAAWCDVLDILEKRTGEMKDGTFVKSEDL